MNKQTPSTNGPGQYPKRDSVEDLDPSATNEPPAGRPDEVRGQGERQKQERGNRGPDEQPGFGQGA